MNGVKTGRPRRWGDGVLIFLLCFALFMNAAVSVLGAAHRSGLAQVPAKGSCRLTLARQGDAVGFRR